VRLEQAIKVVIVVELVHPVTTLGKRGVLVKSLRAAAMIKNEDEEVAGTDFGFRISAPGQFGREGAVSRSACRIAPGIRARTAQRAFPTNQTGGNNGAKRHPACGTARKNRLQGETL
jgi:hypothetical protein